MLTGQTFHVDIAGEFVKKNVAKGTVEREDCDAFDFKAKFIGNAG